MGGKLGEQTILLATESSEMIAMSMALADFTFNIENLLPRPFRLQLVTKLLNLER